MWPRVVVKSNQKVVVFLALVAQWTEHLTSDQTVGSSSLSGGTSQIFVADTFHRDLFTWLAYLLLAFYGYFLNVLSFLPFRIYML